MESPWRSRLYARLRGQAYPLFVFDETILPAASVWAGMRLWIAAFREAGLRPGDRIIVALPPSPGFLCALLAGLWEELTLALLSPGGDWRSAGQHLDISASIGNAETEATWQADSCGLPCRTGRALRSTRTPPTPEARLLLATSGTTAAPRWIALSDRNVLAVIESHLPHLGLTGARLLSTLPWHHAFGLVIDLLPALLSGAEIIRNGDGGRDPARLVEMMNAHGVTHLNAVPLTIERLLQTPGGALALSRLRGGVIGGAPVGAGLALALRQTTLRAGYGQTEASPGITLGAPGRWELGYLGQPLGCAIEVDGNGGLRFSGPNACLGFWGEAGLETLPANRWVETGDLVRAEGRDLYFLARADHAFKLSNGRRVEAGLWESILRVQAPQVRHALLYTPDGARLELLVGLAPDAPAFSLAQAREILGPLGTRLCQVYPLPPERWVRTPKGDVDRRRILETLHDRK